MLQAPLNTHRTAQPPLAQACLHHLKEVGGTLQTGERASPGMKGQICCSKVYQHEEHPPSFLELHVRREKHTPPKEDPPEKK